ncbi:MULTISPECIES: HEPN domain-containing protein [Acidithiobacillus]|uniref:HEPN domain-containing protein n=2 Tax=Acidithiobacillus TaxID=119977 RepID=A0A179BCA7_ACIFR|nr:MULTISPECIES: HEPN domain-containing protein [Acidithiobacillus]MBU2854777.1 HEPN domain-containing protein [Acidithiobacillus ferriphilus]MEB8485627.1 HEPN domain-containing protein [Acidithiobacillus ferriphilus]MEB8491620.1 HEPN domain-containing protein [Acidithiobacillus ferriphilus]MEB8492623.1 HEPN domain-containing protein [Acidithiobacillus ferriphilus]MEB8515512.1 HEPN domain-containing protein [Acidithiobacillus ferriphilus]
MSVSAQQLDAVRWLKQSGSDLVAARQLRDGGSFAQSCFFSQQSAEKLFKGAIILLKGAIPRSHSVQDLSNMLRAEYAVPLDNFYTVSRYSDASPSEMSPFELYDVDDAQEAIHLVEQAMRVTLQWLGEQNLMPEGYSLAPYAKAETAPGF